MGFVGGGNVFQYYSDAWFPGISFFTDGTLPVNCLPDDFNNSAKIH